LKINTAAIIGNLLFKDKKQACCNIFLTLQTFAALFALIIFQQSVDKLLTGF
jgi:hypothetical protein